MSNWRDRILREFAPKVARLTLVADPDGLLLEEGILEGIRERGFELVPFEDHIAFRYAYESRFRSRWDLGEQTDLVVVLRSEDGDLGEVPFDLLQAGRKLSFNLGDIFPNLSYPVVAALNRGDLDALYEAQKRHAPGRLGENATKEFVLRHVFEVAAELIKQPSDLLRMLLRCHYGGQRIPVPLNMRLVELLRKNPQFDQWPLEKLLADKEAFFTFLQERWSAFLDREANGGASGTAEGQNTYPLSLEGPLEIPFGHHDVRIYIDNLFTEGFLTPVPHDRAESLAKTWVGIGISTSPETDRAKRLGRLVENLQSAIPLAEAKHTEWLRFAHGWAEMVWLLNQCPADTPENLRGNVEEIKEKAERAFTDWVLKRYSGLANLPPVPPVMLHHIPRFLGRQLENNSLEKVALVVVDGLSLDQWLVVKNRLEAGNPGLLFREQAVFSWIPSLTSVSRQSLFAGKPPVFFPGSIQTTDKEPALWSQYWAEQGFGVNQVAYIKGLGEGGLEPVSETLSHPRLRVAGIVVDKVDKIMHGMEMGTAGMHNQVGQWAQQPYFGNLLELLLDEGFKVYMTSDHGNIEAKGCGRPGEGATADLRGERVRIYPDRTLRRKVKENFPTSLEWDSPGLPEKYYPLLAPARKAFIQEGQRTVSHGGLSIEEIIVPLVQIERRKG